MADLQLTVAQALQLAVGRGLERLDAQLLLLHALQRPAGERAWLLAHDGDLLTLEQQQRFAQLTLRRAQGEPLAYLTGRKEFFGLDLEVDARVLVPRPDTETLVEWALELLARPLPGQQQGAEPASLGDADVLDLGTGSGAVALAIQHARPDLRVHAVDASADALQVARCNAARLNLAVVFTQGSWLDAVSASYRVIVSNPPYIAARDPHLEALAHEPLQALVSGSDGLDDIRQIVEQSGPHLLPGGWLLLEHGYDQAAAVRELLDAAGYAEVQSRRDLGGIERCSGGRKRGC